MFAFLRNRKVGVLLRFYRVSHIRLREVLLRGRLRHVRRWLLHPLHWLRLWFLHGPLCRFLHPVQRRIFCGSCLDCLRLLLLHVLSVPHFSLLLRIRICCIRIFCVWILCICIRLIPRSHILVSIRFLCPVRFHWPVKLSCTAGENLPGFFKAPKARLGQFSGCSLQIVIILRLRRYHFPGRKIG